jgi:activator of 2-hydroxyglutaryl-CoA dehydratase
MGAYKSMAVRCNGTRLLRVARNTKCAASSGIYLERLASVLHVNVEEMGTLSRASTEKVEVLGSCAVFGESAVIGLLHLKKKVPDILKGIFASLAHQIHPVLANVGVEPDMVMCGGVARNAGVVDALKKFLKIDISVPDYPDTVSALGAALIAQPTATITE